MAVIEKWCEKCSENSSRERTYLMWALAATSISAIFLVPFFWSWANSNPNAAAWVQAFGSIGAIYFSLRGISLQLKGQREQQIEAEQRKDDKEAMELESKLKDYRIKQYIIIYGAYFQVSQWGRAVLEEFKEDKIDWEAFSVGCRITNDAINVLNIDDFPTAFDIINITSVRIHMELIYQTLLDAKKHGYANGHPGVNDTMSIIREFYEKTKQMKINMLNQVVRDASLEEVKSIYDYLKNSDPDIELVNKSQLNA